MAHRWKNDLTYADVTAETVWLNRRQAIAGALGAGAMATIGGPALAEDLKPNSWKDITTYNNYYEFGTGKNDPAKYAHKLNTKDWS
ncbi:MAG: hypothetical protein ACKVKR_05600, partial [Pseudomonadales bacterium]